MRNVTQLRAINKNDNEKINVPPPRNHDPRDRLGYLALNPEVYPWAEEGAYALFRFGRVTNGHLHAVDLGEGELLAYVTFVDRLTLRLKFICAGFESGNYVKDEVRIVGRVVDLHISDDPYVCWEIKDPVVEEAVKRLYERPLIKVSAK